jgi:hypothetical protein
MRTLKLILSYLVILFLYFIKVITKDILNKNNMELIILNHREFSSIAIVNN